MYGPLIDVQLPGALHLILIGLMIAGVIIITSSPLHTLYDRWRHWIKKVRKSNRN